MNEVICARIHMGVKSLIVVLGFLLITGCGEVPPKRVYQPNPPGQADKPMPLKIAVVELEDRSPGNGFTNWHLFEVFTPGYFYRTQFQKYHHTLFGTCLAAELEQSHLFEVVDYHPDWERVAYGFRSYDVIVTGRLHHDKFERIEYTYGLCDPICVVVMFLGLPLEAISREANFEVTAFKPLEPDRQSLTHSVRFQDSKIQGLYNRGASDLNSMHVLVNGHNVSGTHFDTDFCPTELLRPHFLALKNSLHGALMQNIAGKDNAAFSQEKAKERNAP